MKIVQKYPRKVVTTLGSIFKFAGVFSKKRTAGRALPLRETRKKLLPAPGVSSKEFLLTSPQEKIVKFKFCKNLEGRTIGVQKIKDFLMIFHRSLLKKWLFRRSKWKHGRFVLILSISTVSFLIGKLTISWILIATPWRGRHFHFHGILVTKLRVIWRLF